MATAAEEAAEENIESAILAKLKTSMSDPNPRLLGDPGTKIPVSFSSGTSIRMGATAAAAELCATPKKTAMEEMVKIPA